MKIISTALLAAGLASLAACGGGAANNAAAANNTAEAPPVVENGGELNTVPPVDTNATNTVSANASGNATATNSVGNGL